jgi:ParB/RepB/Spo0J family partition protein
MTQVVEVQEIPISQTTVSSRNPREQKFSGEEFDGLVESVRAQGVIQPVIAVRENGHFEVVDGSRRLAAAKRAGRTTIPAIVRELEITEQEVAEIALTANLQRKDLTPLEEARGYKGWLDLTKKTQAELAKRVGKAPSTIANALRLLDAAPAIQKALEKGDITAAHAKVAMSVPEKALGLVDLKKDVSVHELEEQAREAQRSFTAVERIRAAIAKAEASGKVVTWQTRSQYGDHRATIWLGGIEVDVARTFGEPKKKLAGILGRGYNVVERATHDIDCTCDAVALNSNGDLVAACVSPTGWKKAQARARENMGRATPAQRKKAKTAEQRRKDAARDLKTSQKTAASALESPDRWRSVDPKKIDERYLRGGLAGEPARLALFGKAARVSGRGKVWKVELWKKITAMPLKDVRERVARLAVASAFGEIRYAGSYGGPPVSATIRRLVEEHYAPRKAKKKGAKR